MACGDMVIKCASNRDRISQPVGAIAFEMESAGIFQSFAGIVIKGVCGYADSHKHKQWQDYAAGTAAAATKAVLEQFTPQDRPPAEPIDSANQTLQKPLYLVRHKAWVNFVGRDHCLNAIEHSLIREKGDTIQKCFVVYGIGGAGKTQVCLRFAELHRDKFLGVFEVDASTSVTIERDFAAIAEKIGCRATSDDGIDYLSTSQDRWLLIIDNVDLKEGSIRKYFPNTHRGCILMTTRNHRLAIPGTAGNYQLDSMDPEEGISLFLKEVHEYPNTQGNRLIASDIAKELGYLPLALAHAAVPIRHKRCRLEDYREYFQKKTSKS
ncbi:P-loop containing nucleoside triphosphate hydrolase protein [Hypoxylon trugodes]|uniref:P-loop containing nucleoside triphosphate hydrolase protein n=1 Tax=Hypoxylon trugodes TaxID=326681 RepID=UPI00219703BE|nr:P-loop containing nucleoside triphosphate hydrolase protein [Hypoxylon trugodes]KAI1392806.1 P-loop containing nucleoside triphosphate hydrolase protein [Hypoxylon trugodes]